MAEKLGDLNLPQASVLKIIKESIPDNINIGKDVKPALAKAASMFILYLTSQATQSAQNANRKTLVGQDVFDALEEAEFGHFIQPLKEAFKEFKDAKSKKDTKSNVEDEEMDDEENDGNKDN